jgi:uncharacterized protein DUF5672
MDPKVVVRKDPEKYKVAVVIPIYKPFPDLTRNETLSLLQVGKVLAKRDIFLIYPPSVNIDEYIRLFAPGQGKPVPIDSRFFGDSKRANRLGVSPELYSCFASYEYMLLYHIDAYVFSDELDYWCSQGLDYVGAPWFDGNDSPKLPLTFTGVGNGGFSLRRIRSFLEVAQNRSFVNLHLGLSQVYDFLEGENHKTVRKYLFINSFMRIIEPFSGYEDEFWGFTVPRFHKWFTVAKPEQALKFSFEVLPRELYRLNNNQLPFGCHAWEKYDPVFWQSFIDPNFGMKLESEGEYHKREVKLKVG